MPYPILDPTGTAQAARGSAAHSRPAAPRAVRRADLRGATVGLLVNTKQNAAPFLDEVGRLLQERYGATGSWPAPRSTSPPRPRRTWSRR